MSTSSDKTARPLPRALRRVAMVLCLLGMLALPWVRPAAACTVCIDLPEFTAADEIMGAEVVVLARPSKANGFVFEVTTVLRGMPDATDRLPAIPFLVDSRTRAAMKADPDLAVLLTFGEGLPSPDSDGWRKLLILDQMAQDTIASILTKSAAWELGQTVDLSRAGFFAQLLAHPSPAIQRLSLAELSRAPYDLLRQLGTALPADQLVMRLQVLTELPFAPLYIRWLGLSGHPEAERMVRARLSRALDLPDPHVDAWIVAGFEKDPEAALDALSARLQDGAPLNRKFRLLFLDGMAVAGSAHPDLQHRIVPLMGRLLTQDRFLAGPFARAIAPWDAPEVRDILAEVLEHADNLDPASRHMLEYVVGQNG